MTKEPRTSHASLKTVLEEVSKIKGPYEVVYEASNGYGVVHDELAKTASRVVVAHPVQLRLIFRSKHKHNRADAKRSSRSPSALLPDHGTQRPARAPLSPVPPWPAGPYSLSLALARSVRTHSFPTPVPAMLGGPLPPLPAAIARLAWGQPQARRALHPQAKHRRTSHSAPPWGEQLLAHMFSGPGGPTALAASAHGPPPPTRAGGEGTCRPLAAPGPQAAHCSDRTYRTDRTNGRHAHAFLAPCSSHRSYSSYQAAGEVAANSPSAGQRGRSPGDVGKGEGGGGEP